MTKTKFRSRKLDYKRHLEIYREDEIAGFDPHDLNRPIEEVETGVEKEEEKEHHLQVALAQPHGETNGNGVAVHIPTPSTTSKTNNYTKLYNKRFPQPKSLIKYIPLNIEDIFEHYDVDDVDQNWLISFNAKSSKKVDKDSFEQIMCTLEMMFYKGLISFDHHDSLASFNFKQHAASVKIDDKVLEQIFQYWKLRKSSGANSHQLIPRLEHEDKVNKEIDPYVCFRKREIKATRKTRRSELQSFKKLVKLKAELNQTLDILAMVSKREKSRKELVMLEMLEFNYMWSTVERGGYQQYKCAVSAINLGHEKVHQHNIPRIPYKRGTKFVDLHLLLSSKIKLSISKSTLGRSNKPINSFNPPKPSSTKTEQLLQFQPPYYLYPSFVNSTELPKFTLISKQSSSRPDKNNSELPVVGYKRRKGRCGRTFVDRVVLCSSSCSSSLLNDLFPSLETDFYSLKSVVKVVPSVSKPTVQSIYPKESNNTKELPIKDPEAGEKAQNNKT